MTIVNLHPTNQNTITFGTSFQSSISTGFYAMVDTFDFHENERKEILYSLTRYGGKAISYQGRLTPIELHVIVFGSNRNQMLERSEQLAQARSPRGKQQVAGKTKL